MQRRVSELLTSSERTVPPPGEEVMKNWLKGQQPQGMKKLPVPEIPLEYKSLFTRLVMERDEATDQTVKNALWAAINNLVIEMIDPNWYAPKLIDIKWPNLIDKDFCSLQGPLRQRMFDAPAQDSYRIIYGKD